MTATRVQVHVAAPPERVYGALVDGEAVGIWMVPDGMTSVVHAFAGREGGSFRISLTYAGAEGVGKTSAQTDTFHGIFVQLLPAARVVWLCAFETEDPALQGEMTITITLEERDGGTDVIAVHDDLPPGLSAADNETGWRLSLAKLAALVEGR